MTRSLALPAGNPTTLVEAFQTVITLDPAATAIRTPQDRVSISWREYGERVREISSGLAGLGVGHGDTVAIMLTNRPEFHLVDTAALHLGAVPLSLYNTSAPEQIAYVLTHAEAKIVITESQFLDVIRASGVPLDHIVCVDEAAGTVSLEALPSYVPVDFDFEAQWRAVRPDDVCVLVYTSGTTGPPKGVEITHANMIAECRGVHAVADVRFGDRTTSYLPSAHIADRISGHYLQMTNGVQTTDIADLTTIAEALPDVRPTLWLGVPRVWTKIKVAVEAKLGDEPSGVKRRLGNWAIGVGRARTRRQQSGESVGFGLEFQYRLADKLVLSKVRSALGFDELRFGLTGAAAIAPTTLEFFAALGIPVCEVWGLSETSAATTINPVDDIRIGTVGKPIVDVELKVAADGEIKVRGPVVMRGYRNAPEKTAEVIDEQGWFATGDIGFIDADGYLSIVDRKKELIINAAGKNMSPTTIENALQSHLPVAHCVAVIGEGRSYNVALIVLDPEAASQAAARAGRDVVDAADLAKDPAIQRIIDEGVAAGNAKLSRVEQVKKYVIVPEFWAPGGDELTPTLKLRRKPIASKYSAEIESLYS